jgi:ribonuclease E
MIREDAFLGIERLATEDIAYREPPTELRAAGSLDEVDSSGERLSSEEIESIEVGGGEATMDRADSEESDDEPRRRRRRRRGRRSKERGEKQSDLEDADEEVTGFADEAIVRSGEDQRADEGRREERSRGDKRRIETDEEEDAEDRGDGPRSNKNLHREVTPWAEAIGIIVNSNLEARARAPSGGAARGRWTKGDRRG